jgi:beta-1,4-mannosyl-glycoprotein beta-1,4-N-acetylglucosaminyltransferase
VDTFIFYNETKLLEYRLNLLKDIVDHFIVVESTHTFKGQPKKLFFDKSFLKNYNIVHIVVEDLPFLNNPNNNEVWENEKHQRNCIIRGLEKIKLEGPDYFIISDVDEIPDPETLLEIKKNNTITIGQLEQDFYYYNMNNLMNYK